MSDAAESNKRLRTGPAADYLGLAKSTLEKMRCDGTGPEFERPSKRIVVYRVGALDAYLAARRATSTSELPPDPAALPNVAAKVASETTAPAASAPAPAPSTNRRRRRHGPPPAPTTVAEQAALAGTSPTSTPRRRGRSPKSVGAISALRRPGRA